MRKYDVAIIGAGHNGLVTACYLAQAGLNVVVLEKNATVGGAAVTEQFHPGFCNSVAAYTVSLLHPRVITDLNLHQHGLRIIERSAANFWPIDEKQSLLLPNDSEGRQRAIAEFSKHDAVQLPKFERAIETAANTLRDLSLRTPPNASGGIAQLIEAARVGRRVMGGGIEHQRFLIDLFTKSVADVLDQWFENEFVKGAFAFDGIVGAYAAPSTAGTAYVLLHHSFGEVNGKRGAWGHAVGGMGAITQALAKSAHSAGAEIITDAPVEEIKVENQCANGLVRANGEDICAKVIAANVGPKLLFKKLLPDSCVSPELRNRFLNITTGSGTFRMNVALSELPNFTCRPGKTCAPHHGSGIIIGPTLNYLEQAYIDARQQGWSQQPVIEMLIPSTIDDTLAPKGQHVASLFVQHVAPKLPSGRSWENTDEKNAFAEHVIATVTKYAPNFKTSILATQSLSPLDLETRFGMIDGDIFHGQLCLSQLYSARPVLGFADYRMPVEGLYLCGSGAHPGGGVTGVPGLNCAREIIKDLKGWRRHIAPATRRKLGL